MAERFILTLDRHTRELIERQAQDYTEGNSSAYIRGAVVLHALLENKSVRGVDIPGWVTMLYDFDLLNELSALLAKRHPEAQPKSRPKRKT